MWCILYIYILFYLFIIIDIFMFFLFFLRFFVLSYFSIFLDDFFVFSYVFLFCSYLNYCICFLFFPFFWWGSFLFLAFFLLFRGDSRCATVERHNIYYMGVSLNGGTPQNTPKCSFLVGKPIVVGYHHFRKLPYECVNFSVHSSVSYVLLPNVTWMSWHHESVLPCHPSTDFQHHAPPLQALVQEPQRAWKGHGNSLPFRNESCWAPRHWAILVQVEGCVNLHGSSHP